MVDFAREVAQNRPKSVAKTHWLKARLHCMVEEYG